MKKIIFSAALMAFVMVSCNQKNNENKSNTIEKLENDSMAMEMEVDSMKMNHDTKMFACSMHPEVQGKLNDTCSKCGMDLTEPVPGK